MNEFKKLCDLGTIHRKNCDYEISNQSFIKAIEINPQSHHVMLAICKNFVDQGDLKSLEDYKIKLKSLDSVSYSHLECYRIFQSNNTFTEEVLLHYEAVFKTSYSGSEIDWMFYFFLRDRLRNYDGSIGCEVIPRNLFIYFDKNPPDDIQLNVDKIIDSRFFTVNFYNKEMAEFFIGSVFGERSKNLFLRLGHPSAESDFFRFHAVYHFGGYYVDTDESFNFDILSSLISTFKCPLLCFKSKENGGPLESCFFGAVQGSQVIKRAIEILYFNCEKHPNLSMWLKTGPGPITRAVLEEHFYNFDGKNLNHLPLICEKSVLNKFLIPFEPSYRGDERDWRVFEAKKNNN